MIKCVLGAVKIYYKAKYYTEPTNFISTLIQQASKGSKLNEVNAEKIAALQETLTAGEPKLPEEWRSHLIDQLKILNDTLKDGEDGSLVTKKLQTQ